MILLNSIGQIILEWVARGWRLNYITALEAFCNKCYKNHKRNQILIADSPDFNTPSPTADSLPRCPSY